MARKVAYPEVLNLRIDEALSREIKRIAKQRGESESVVARMLLGWGVEAHRRMEGKLLMRPYDYEEPDYTRMVIDVRWEQYDPEDPYNQ
jgi:hypothetical protein